MIDYAITLLQRHGRDGVLVDTNILLMMVVGSYNRALIPNFKRTAQYTVEDFELAMRIIRIVGQVITHPSILTEVSNLAGQLGTRYRMECFATFAHQIGHFTEQRITSAEIASTNEFVRFGLTDAVILQVARNGHLVLTDDFRLSQYMESLGLPALNFTHLRSSNLLE